jgi:5-methylthioadenosine/S-adenosylhomocysteine deaminase
MKILTAEYVLPIAGEPIKEGGVAIESGEIRAVGPAAELVKKFPEARVDDLGPSAILPGFVNCHSHLEITAMRGLLDDIEHDFFTWLMTLTKNRARLSDEEVKLAALAGAVEGAVAGVTCFGDIGRLGEAGVYALTTAGLRGIVFQETEFSPDDERADADFSALIEKAEGLAAKRTELVDIGISPHSPYTVSPKLFEKIAEYAVLHNTSVTIHAAESPEEEALLRSGTGLFAEMHSRFESSWTSPMRSPVEFLRSTGILSAKPLLAHCVMASEGDLEIIEATRSKVAHCPKSNAKFGHGYAPFERMLDKGIAVGLGSDSVASNNACDILEEARFAALAARNRDGRSRFVSSREVLEAATLGGAKALGLENKIGSLEPGKQADIAVVSLKHVAQLPVNDVVHALVFSSNSRDVVMTMVGGEEVVRNGEVRRVDAAYLRKNLREIAERLSL